MPRIRDRVTFWVAITILFNGFYKSCQSVFKSLDVLLMAMQIEVSRGTGRGWDLCC